MDIWRWGDFFISLSKPIIAVKLVYSNQTYPSTKHFQYPLWLATAVKIALVEVDFSNPNTNYEEMHLLTEPLFSVPIDEAYIVTNTYDQRSNFHGSDTWLHVRMFCSGFSLDS